MNYQILTNGDGFGVFDQYSVAAQVVDGEGPETRSARERLHAFSKALSFKA
jgi:hypothetical protein